MLLANDSPNQTAVLSVKDVAKELGVSASLVYRLCAAGKIHHERHGLGRGTIRIPREALDEYRKSTEVRRKIATRPLHHLTLS